jgi:hypothetical protein
MPTRLCCFVLAATAACGCAPLAKAAKQPSGLPPARLAPDAVVFEVAFVRLPSADSSTYDAIWEAADEQRLSADLRRQLAANGLRAGVFGQELPLKLRELLDRPTNVLAELSQGSGGEPDVGTSRQRLPARAGHRSIIKASKVYPSLAVLQCDDGAVHGHDLRDARCIFSLKPYPQGDGRVKLMLTPEIEHGESKSHFVASEGMWIQQTGQERLVLDRLAIDCVLSPGQTLLVSMTPEMKGIGEQFFLQSRGSVAERRMLLLHYAQNQFDDLFAPEQTSAPLATPGE